MESLTKFQLLDVIFYFDEWIKESNQPMTVSEFYKKEYPLLKQLQNITLDNNGPIECFDFILGETGKAISADFCEACCGSIDNCQGALPASKLREAVKKYGDLLNGDDD